MLVFFGLVFIPPERAAAFPTVRADGIAQFLEHVLIEGKFYSVFSLLFGIGFGIQLERGGAEVLPRFRRRLRILLAIGALHAFLIWAGDILMLYALLGFTLPWFARRTNRVLVRYAVLLLAVPTALYLAGLVVWLAVHSGSAPASVPSPPPGILRRFEAVGTGGIKEAFVGNLIFVAGRWADLFVTVRFPKVLGMFVLGLWAVRAGLALDPTAHRRTLAKWSLLGWSIGLPANLLATWVLERGPYLPPSPGGLLGVALQAVGIPLLALGYAATAGLLVVSGSRWIGAFAPVGRMALSNYLSQSLICVVLSYGFGFGLWWHTGAAKAMLIAAIIIVAQIGLSAYLMSRFRFGPVEWVWRRLTYGRPI